MFGICFCCVWFNRRSFWIGLYIFLWSSAQRTTIASTSLRILVEQLLLKFFETFWISIRLCVSFRLFNKALVFNVFLFVCMWCYCIRTLQLLNIALLFLRSIQQWHIHHTCTHTHTRAHSAWLLNWLTDKIQNVNEYTVAFIMIYGGAVSILRDFWNFHRKWLFKCMG